jgi:hypothetical protein
VAIEATWPDRGRPTIQWVDVMQNLVAAQLATGQAEAARATARALLDAQLSTGVPLGAWRTRITAEQLALACARTGDFEAARAGLRTMEAVGLDPRTPPVPAADSALRRAQMWQALGESAAARAEAAWALDHLKGQHAESPRLVLARSLLESR